jgi:hypothetical protein
MHMLDGGDAPKFMPPDATSAHITIVALDRIQYLTA